jgi:hypothetical protein
LRRDAVTLLFLSVTEPHFASTRDWTAVHVFATLMTRVRAMNCGKTRRVSSGGSIFT